MRSLTIPPNAHDLFPANCLAHCFLHSLQASLTRVLIACLVCGLLPCTLLAQTNQTEEKGAGHDAAQISVEADAVNSDEVAITTPNSTDVTTNRAMVTVSRASVLVGSFTVFLLAVFVGFEIIAKVPPTLHTPLMSGSNAISGITVVGAMITAGAAAVSYSDWFGTLLGLVAVVLAMINVVGGFLVTHRMLMMFKKR